jgi:glycosyltransferase involved in cell wall biosynthesis
VPLAIGGRRGAAGDRLLDHSRRLLALSDRSVDVFQRAGVPPAKIVRDWHFLPDDLVPTRADDRPGDHWLFVGRLTTEKGIDRLVEEWPADVPLVIVGDGPLRPSLERAAVGKRIELRGAIPRAAVVRELSVARGLVVPSRWYETFGLIYIEALAVGTPVLAFAPNVVADAVVAEGTGLVADWGRLPEALSAATAKFPDLRDRCRTMFEERYTEAAFGQRRPRLYESVLATTP